MSKEVSKVKKLRLNASKFLKIVPDRIKKIANAGTEEVKHLGEYRPNAIAAVIHPQVQHVKVSDVIELNQNVKLFKLIPDKEAGTARLAPFAAGSCVSAEIVIDGIRYRRPYSISSSPLEGYYEIIVKKVEGGKVSGFLHDNVKPGYCFDISDPFGEFNYDPIRDAKTVIGIAGGVGFTPFRSFIKAISDGAEDFELILFCGVASKDDIILKDDLEELSGSSKIKVVFVVSGEGPVPEGWEKGFVTAELIKKYAPETDYSVFACGPDSMYRFLEEELKKLGIRRKFIRFDYKGEPADPEKEPDYIKAGEKSYKLTLRRCGRVNEIECGSDETIFKAIERSGLYLQTKCMSGECGYCHTKVLIGEYYMPESRDGRRAADRTYGYIHPCCTYPRSDMELLLP